MRILMLTQFYLPTIGGEETQVRTLSNALAQRGHDVAVATLWREGVAEFEMDRDVRIYRIRSSVQRARWLFQDSERRHAPPFPDPEAVLALRQVIAREQPDIVHAHNWLVHSFLPLKAWSGASLILTLHDYSLLCAKKRLMFNDAPCNGPGVRKCLSCASDHYGVAKGWTTVLGNWMMGMAERSAVDMFLPVSHAVAVGNGLLDADLPYEVIPNFVSDDITVPQEEMHSELAQLPDKDYLLFVGDLGYEKGVDVLLRAYAGLADAPPLVLIGRMFGDLPIELPPNVTVLKSLPHRAVMQAWRRSLAVIVPSVWPEPFGIVAIEAMASGCPVIASRIGGLSDIVVDGETGFLVPPGDVGAVRAAIERLLADPELRTRMGQAGKQRISEFQASTILPRIEAVYQSVVKSGRTTKETQHSAVEQAYRSAEESQVAKIN